MRLRTLAVALCVASLGVSGAAAAPPAGKGKPETAGKPATTGATCKPKVTVVLKGKLTGTAAGSLAMDVTQANRWGRAWASLGTASVVVDDTTKVRRNGQKLVTDLVVGDRLLVQARACKADLTSKTLPSLTVVRVVAHPAKA